MEAALFECVSGKVQLESGLAMLRTPHRLVGLIPCLLAATARPPLMKDSGIKAMIKELADTSGSKAQPMTIGTTRMLRAALHDVIPRLWADQPLIQARESVNLINEAIGALRVGESCNGGGEGYGLDADNTMIVTNLATGEVTTWELYLKCSKTHLGRWVDMADVTLGSGARVVDA